MSALTVLLFVSVVLVALVAGLHVCGSAALNPVFDALDASTFVIVKQACDVSFPRLARPLMLASIAACAASTVVAAASSAGRVAALCGVGLAALLMTLAAILRGDLPINREMAAWQPSAPPADWRDVLRRWNRYFTVRTAASLAALAVLTAAALSAR